VGKVARWLPILSVWVPTSASHAHAGGPGRRGSAWPCLARPSHGATSSYSPHDGAMRETLLLGPHALPPSASSGFKVAYRGFRSCPDPVLRVSPLHRCRACGRRSLSLLHGLLVACGTMSSLVVFSGGMGGWVSSSLWCSRLSTLHDGFCCFEVHFLSSSSVAGCGRVSPFFAWSLFGRRGRFVIVLVTGLQLLSFF
jgi:hypothetical protein